MLLFELFDRPNDQIRQIDGDTAYKKYRLHDVHTAYVFQAGARKIVVYFDNCGGGDSVTMGFAFEKENDKGVSHSLTKDGKPLQVLPTVIQCLFQYMKEHQPVTLYFSGASQRQSVFYRALLQRLKDHIPSPYRLLVGGYDNGRFYITRDPNPPSDLKPFDEAPKPFRDQRWDRPLHGNTDGFQI